MVVVGRYGKGVGKERRWQEGKGLHAQWGGEGWGREFVGSGEGSGSTQEPVAEEETRLGGISGVGQWQAGSKVLHGCKGGRNHA